MTLDVKDELGNGITGLTMDDIFLKFDDNHFGSLIDVQFSTRELSNLNAANDISIENFTDNGDGTYGFDFNPDDNGTTQVNVFVGEPGDLIEIETGLAFVVTGN